MDEDDALSAGGVPQEQAPTDVAITIDNLRYVTPARLAKGEYIRAIPFPPISDDKHLWLEAQPNDRLIDLNDDVDIVDGLRFFTAPKLINAGTAPTEPVKLCRRGYCDRVQGHSGRCETADDEAVPTEDSQR